MVEKITFFEPHFDGAQFGPASLESEDASDRPTTTDVEQDETAAGRSRAVPLLVAGGLALGLLLGLLGLRRARKGDSVQVELDDAHEEELAAQ